MSFLPHFSCKQSTRAFTLIETLVSILIISTVILGPLTVAMGASAYARETKDTIIATYLAQEALELLHHQQDSLFLKCIGETITGCVIAAGETPSQAAWRVFQNRMGANAQGTSCFGTDDAAGCTYDFIDMTGNEDTNPSKYSFSSNSCSRLSVSSSHLYVCTGAHGAGYQETQFARSISITTLPTFDAAVNNDLRVTATVSFKRSTGYPRQIKIVDFFHAHS